MHTVLHTVLHTALQTKLHTILHSANCTAHCTVNFTAHCTLYCTLYCTLHTVLHTVLHTILHTAHCVPGLPSDHPYLLSSILYHTPLSQPPVFSRSQESWASRIYRTRGCIFPGLSLYLPLYFCSFWAMPEAEAIVIYRWQPRQGIDSRCWGEWGQCALSTVLYCTVLYCHTISPSNCVTGECFNFGVDFWRDNDDYWTAACTVVDCTLLLCTVL